MHVVQNRKEAKKVIFLKHIFVNGKIPRDEKNPVLLFDIISLAPSEKNYRLDLSEKGKFELKEVNKKDVGRKIAKIIDKKILRGRKIQLNLQDGRNILSDMKCAVNDSVFVNLIDKKVERCLPLKENARAFVFSGKHTGKRGKIISFNKNKNIVEIEKSDGEKFSVLIKQIMIIE